MCFRETWRCVVRGPEVTVELKHMISSSFWSLFYFRCSAPDNPHCYSYFSHSDLTHRSLTLFDFAPVCHVQLFFSDVFFLLMLSVSFPWWKHSTLTTWTVVLMVQSYIKSLGNCTGRREQMFLLNQRVTWWSIQSPCGKQEKKSHDHLSVFSEHRDWVFLYVWKRASKSVALHGQSHLTAPSISNSTPPLLQLPIPGDGVTQLFSSVQPHHI